MLANSECRLLSGECLLYTKNGVPACTKTGQFTFATVRYDIFCEMKIL